MKSFRSIRPRKFLFWLFIGCHLLWAAFAFREYLEPAQRRQIYACRIWKDTCGSGDRVSIDTDLVNCPANKIACDSNHILVALRSMVVGLLNFYNPFTYLLPLCPAGSTCAYLLWKSYDAILVVAPVAVLRFLFVIFQKLWGGSNNKYQMDNPHGLTDLAVVNNHWNEILGYGALRNRVNTTSSNKLLLPPADHRVTDLSDGGYDPLQASWQDVDVQ